MTNIKEDKKGVFKKWLETLQQESWQLELLISGLALFGVFGAKTFIDDFEVFVSTQFISGTASLLVAIFTFLLKGSWYIFLINLLIHIILRGLWIGAIGLRYVSEDIDYDQLNFSNYFRKLYTKRYESFDDYIEDLEKICSVIFAYTFLLFFILISSCFFLIWPALFIPLFGQFTGGFIILIYLSLGLIVFVDFITLNPLKKIKEIWFSKVYGFIFRLYSTLTLSFVFRPLLLNFLDNKFTKRLFLFSIPYGVIIIILVPKLTGESKEFFPNFSSNNLQYRAYSSESFNPNLYDDLTAGDDKSIPFISLKEYRTSSDIFEFFLTHLKPDQAYFKEEIGITAINRVGVYTGFGKQTNVDSSFQVLKDEHVSQRLAFLNRKRENLEEQTKFVWDSLYQSLETSHSKIEFEWYSNKIALINSSFKEMHKFYIDDIDISQKVECYITEHERRGSNGWKCLTELDSLSTGIHRFRVERGVYRSKIKVLSPIFLEIPFIFDKS